MLCLATVKTKLLVLDIILLCTHHRCIITQLIFGCCCVKYFVRNDERIILQLLANHNINVNKIIKNIEKRKEHKRKCKKYK